MLAMEVGEGLAGKLRKHMSGTPGHTSPCSPESPASCRVLPSLMRHDPVPAFRAVRQLPILVERALAPGAVIGAANRVEQQPAAFVVGLIAVLRREGRMRPARRGDHRHAILRRTGQHLADLGAISSAAALDAAMMWSSPSSSGAAARKDAPESALSCRAGCGRSSSPRTGSPDRGSPYGPSRDRGRGW